jgi:uncharacterized protein (TIGR02246 family)
MTSLPQPALTESEVSAAAAHLVDAFARTDTDAYFGCFAEDATFVFHTEGQRLESRRAYEELWVGWIADGWRVASCVSTDQRVQVFGETAVFTHAVTTETSVGAGIDRTSERETIVFVRDSATGGLVAIHEHLSPAPQSTPSDDDRGVTA